MTEKPSHPYGKPENVLKFSADNKLELNEAPLKMMFEHPEVKNRKIVAFSIIGAFRKGKSFLLDYCLRFLYANYKSINFPDNPLTSTEQWLGASDERLLGFSWRSGSNRDTTGIIMWSDVFLHTVPATGERLAIVVIDTQGLFDHETSPMDNSRIFALGTLISSIQILNINSIVQEDQLQYLQFATDFTKFAASDSHGTADKPFQSLMFLIRDWTNDDEYPFGSEGGNSYLKHFLKMSSDQKEEMRSVREFIRGSFEELSCFLLPHPGLVVAGIRKSKPSYNGNWGVMDEDFRAVLEQLVRHLLAPHRLTVKKISGRELRGEEFKQYLDAYFELFQSDKLPQAQSIYESTVEKQMNLLVQECLELYKESLYTKKDLVTLPEHIGLFNDCSRSAALMRFKETKKMGSASHHEKFQRVLETLIEDAFRQFSDTSEESVKQIEAEKERVRLALEEKERAHQQQMEDVKAHIARLDKLSAEQAVDIGYYREEKRIRDEQLRAEEERKRALEAQRKRCLVM